MAGALVTECSLDEDEVRWILLRNDLPGRSNTHEELTPSGKQLFGNQDSERCADRTADDLEFDITER